MCRLKDMEIHMAKHQSFNPHSSLEKRALQAWLILIGAAWRRETVTYTDLAIAMFGNRALRHLGKILGHIAYYCEQHRLPYLNCIVVGKFSGQPGWKVPVYNDKERERVYHYLWFHVVPPSPEELKTAWESD